MMPRSKEKSHFTARVYIRRLALWPSGLAENAELIRSSFGVSSRTRSSLEACANRRAEIAYQGGDNTYE